MHLLYALQESFKKELEHLHEQQIIIALGVEETAELCNKFVMVKN